MSYNQVGFECPLVTHSGHRPCIQRTYSEADSDPFQNPNPSRYDTSSEPGADMRRGDFITLLAGTAAGWPREV